MAEKEKLCPFKKTTERERNPVTGRETIHERFEVCAGKRCMAYNDSFSVKASRCLRLEGSKAEFKS